jgi:hypothetical protein
LIKYDYLFNNGPLPENMVAMTDDEYVENEKKNLDNLSASVDTNQKNDNKK